MKKTFIKTISILLITSFALSISAHIVLAQSQGENPPIENKTLQQPEQTKQRGTQAGQQPTPQEQSKKDDKNKKKEPQETPITFGSSVINLLVGSISDMLSGLLAFIIYFEAYVINYILGAFQFTKAPIVTTGWGITRDIANMFFILALIIIALATILRIKGFATGQLLWRVIVAALLVNFSLVIAGVLIDFAQIVTQYFIKAAVGNSATDFASRLANATRITSFYEPGPGSIAIFEAGKSVFLSILALLFKLVALIIMVFVFGATAIFLVARVAWLWLLLLVAPITWALWAFPGQGGRFSEWWSSFLKWTFFTPIYAVAIFFALTMTTTSGGGFNIASNIASNSVPQAFSQQANYISASAPQVILQFIVMIILFIAPLIVAQKLGILGAKEAINVGKSWGLGTVNFAGRQLRRQALALGAVAAVPGVAAKPGLLVRGAQRAAALPGGRFLTSQVFKMVETEAKTVEEAKKQFESWSPEAIQNYLSRPGGPTPQVIGAALALKDKGKLEKLGETRIKELAALASKHSPKNIDELLKIAPHLAPDFNKTIKAVVGKIEKASSIMLESLSNSEVVTQLNPDQFKDIARNADTEKIKRAKSVIEAEFAGLDNAIRNEIQTKIFNQKDKRLRNEALAGLTSRNERHGNIARGKIATSSPAWEV